MKTILGLIEFGCFTGMGFYIGFEVVKAIVDLLQQGISLIIKETLD